MERRGGREEGEEGERREKGKGRREPYNEIEAVSASEGCVSQCLDNRYVSILHLRVLAH